MCFLGGVALCKSCRSCWHGPNQVQSNEVTSRRSCRECRVCECIWGDALSLNGQARWPWGWGGGQVLVGHGRASGKVRAIMLVVPSLLPLEAAAQGSTWEVLLWFRLGGTAVSGSSLMLDL